MKVEKQHKSGGWQISSRYGLQIFGEDGDEIASIHGSREFWERLARKAAKQAGLSISGR